jgi:hypothetical protein
MDTDTDRPRLRRWLGAIEKPSRFCPHCNELASGPDHSECVRQWARLLRFAYSVEDYGPDDSFDERPPPLPCEVVSREARVNVLSARYDAGEALRHEDDLCGIPDLEGLALEVERLANGAIEEGEVQLG